jgi:hypothetical protein
MQAWYQPGQNAQAGAENREDDYQYNFEHDCITFY